MPGSLVVRVRACGHGISLSMVLMRSTRAVSSRSSAGTAVTNTVLSRVGSRPVVALIRARISSRPASELSASRRAMRKQGGGAQGVEGAEAVAAAFGQCGTTVDGLDGGDDDGEAFDGERAEAAAGDEEDDDEAGRIHTVPAMNQSGT